MKRNSLIKSRVCFDAAAHTYDLNGRMLGGVTPIVHWVFDKTYDGISAERLAEAAAYGTSVHNACELFDDENIITEEFSDVIAAYSKLLEDAGLKPLCSEYLVSDDAYIASSIDKVFKPTRNVYPLADIKTTSKFLVANVTLQLSIYAWLFEMQNPTRKAGKLFCIWLPKPKYGKPTLFEIERIPSDSVEEIVLAYLNGNEDKRAYCQTLVDFYCPTTSISVCDTLPAKFADVEKEVARIEAEVKRMEERSKELRAGLLAEMQKYEKYNWEGDYLILTRKKATTRTTLDSAKVKAQYPDVFEACKKESNVSESLTIKIK